MQTQTQET